MLAFLQFLYENSLSLRVIANHIGSLKAKGRNCLDGQLMGCCTFPNPLCTFKNITNNSSFTPRFKGYFDNLPYKLLIWNAPHSKPAFTPARHLLGKDVIFAPPGTHIQIKWAKNMQQATAHKFVKI